MDQRPKEGLRGIFLQQLQVGTIQQPLLLTLWRIKFHQKILNNILQLQSHITVKIQIQVSRLHMTRKIVVSYNKGQCRFSYFHHDLYCVVNAFPCLEPKDYK